MITIKTLPRSDAAMQQEIEDKLQQNMYTKKSKIKTQVKDGVATLSGDVGDYMTRFIAQRCAFQVDGVHKVINRIRVRIVPKPVLEPPSGDTRHHIVM